MTQGTIDSGICFKVMAWSVKFKIPHEAAGGDWRKNKKCYEDTSFTQ